MVAAVSREAIRPVAGTGDPAHLLGHVISLDPTRLTDRRRCVLVADARRWQPEARAPRQTETRSDR